MKILVTGGGGFIGSHVAEFYAKQMNEVVVFDNLSRGEFIKASDEAADFNWNYLKKYDNVKHVRGDIRDYEALESAMKGCEVVFHTAAQTVPKSSIADPVEDFTANSLGTFNLLETARRNNPTPKIIHTSTSKIYGINANRYAVEKDDCYTLSSEHSGGFSEKLSIDGIGRTPFGTSKLSADLYMQEYAHLFGLKIGIFRLSTVYGARGFGFEEQGWMSEYTAQALIDKRIDIFGDGRQTSDPLFVGDLVNAFDTFLNSEMRGGVFNIGGGIDNKISRLQFIELLKEKTGKEPKVKFNEAEPYDQKIFVSDNSKIKNLLGWSPTVNLKEGIQEMFQWIEANL
jgi:CDP-paratose 2-epimerase